MKTKKTIDILIEAINMVKNEELRRLIFKAFTQYNDELLEMNENIAKILKE
jgi:hypothetical protein